MLTCMPSLIAVSEDVTMSSNAKPKLLPSNANIILANNAELCRVILQVVAVHHLHIPPKKFSHAVSFLWTANGDGPFDGQYSKWVLRRTNRQITERIQAILAHYSVWTTEYPSDIQVLARRLVDEHKEARAAVEATREEQRRIEAAIQEANDHREGQLGLLPPQRGVDPPVAHGESRGVREQNAVAAALLAANPRSQNDGGDDLDDRCRREWF